MDESTPMTLAGRRIALAESRQLDVLASLLERRGAEVIRCPLVGIRDTAQTEHVRAWLDTLIRLPFDDLILLTGEGLRRLHAFAQRHGQDQAFIGALGQCRTICRGPKPARVLRELGLPPGTLSPQPTTEGVIELLSSEKLYDRRVGVQLYGDDPNAPLREFLDRAGAHEFVVAPYEYVDALDDPDVAALIEQICGGHIDALCFTSSPQVRRLLRVADALGRRDALDRAWRSITVVAVGPVVAETLVKNGIRVGLMPPSSWFMKPMVRELERHFDRGAQVSESSNGTNLAGS